MASMGQRSYLPHMDARRNQVYTGLYHFRDRFEVVKNQWPSDVRELVDELNERGEKVIFLGGRRKSALQSLD